MDKKSWHHQRYTMAVDLVLRICQVHEDDGGVPTDRHIAITPFVTSLYDVLFGYHTLAQVKTRFLMTAQEQADFDIIVGKVQSASTFENQIYRVMRIESILLKWEHKDYSLATYTTPDEIQTHLLAIDTDGSV